MKMLRFAILIGFSIFFAGSVSANTEFIGSLLLDGVKITENAGVFKDDEGGRWTAADIAFLPGGSLTIFESAITLEGLPTVPRVLAKAKQDGIGVILSGRINNVHISGWIYHSTRWGRQIWIEPHKITRTEIGRVTSGLQPIAGGTMDLKGSPIEIENLTDFVAKREGVQGTFEITAWNRVIQNAQLSFAGGCRATATLASHLDDTVKLHVDINNGLTKLWDGSLDAENIPMTGKSLTVGLATLGTPQLIVKRAAIIAKGGTLSTSLTAVGGGVQTVDLRTGSTGLSTGDGEVFWDSGTAQGEHDTTAATFGVLEVHGGSIKAAKARLFASDQTLVAGALAASQLMLSTEALKGSLDWDRPAIPFMSFWLLATLASTSPWHSTVNGVSRSWSQEL